MANQFAAHLRNPGTNDEYMIVADTAEEAEALAFEQAKIGAKQGVALEIILGPFSGPSPYPTGLIEKMDWR